MSADVWNLRRYIPSYSFIHTFTGLSLYSFISHTIASVQPVQKCLWSVQRANAEMKRECGDMAVEEMVIVHTL